MAFFFGKEDHEDCDCSEDGEEECENRREIHCRLSDPCYDLYCGIVDTHIGPIGGKRHHAEIEFRFCARAEEIEHIFLLCRYTGCL